MDHIVFVVILAGLVSSGYGTPLAQDSANITIQQLYSAMDQLVIKYMQLDKSQKQLQEDNAKLSTRNDQLTRQLENERNKSATRERKFDETIKRVSAELGKCESIKSSLRTNQIIHHHVLNASNIAHLECQKNLKGMQGIKTQLEKCQKMNRSFQTNQIIHNRELNASNIAYQECQKNLTELQGVKTKLTGLSCKGWKDAGFRTDGNYMIDPDGPGGVDSFVVECLMTGHKGEPVTVMHHNSENKTQVGPGLSYGGYTTEKNVVYQASIPQIVAAISTSAKCEQFIKLDCCGTPITNHCTWYSRDGTPMYYWGGAAPGSGKCACGMTNTCDTGSNCNCDANDNTWRADSGLLTDRNTLPVTKMAFGDLDAEHAFHTLGPLRCYG